MNTEKELKALIGKNVTFIAQRIVEGNPVTGKLISVSDEWIDVQLSKTIEGINTIWYNGTEKSFRLVLVGEIKEDK